jgi:hypothetical protein
MNETLARWHEFVETGNPEILGAILAGEVKFHSPFVWRPKDGKAVAVKILTTVVTVFEDFRYVREIIDGPHAALEFEARVGELTLRGVDLIQFDEDGKIIDFEVMIRPANALQALGVEMGRKLAES